MKTSFLSGQYAMSYNVEGFKFRADECVRLANLSKDQMIQRELLSLRQVYLKAAERLGEIGPVTPQKLSRPA